MSEVLHPSGLPNYFRAFGVALVFTVASMYVQQSLSPYDHQRVFGLFDVNTMLQAIPVAMMVVWGFSAFFSLAVFLFNRFKSIEVLDNQLVYREGIFNTKSITLSYLKINNVNVRRSFFQRMVGLGSLDLDTIAGGAVSVVHFDNLPYPGIELILKNSEIRYLKPK